MEALETSGVISRHASVIRTAPTQTWLCLMFCISAFCKIYCVCECVSGCFVSVFVLQMESDYLIQFYVRLLPEAEAAQKV